MLPRRVSQLTSPSSGQEANELINVFPSCFLYACVNVVGNDRARVRVDRCGSIYYVLAVRVCSILVCDLCSCSN